MPTTPARREVTFTSIDQVMTDVDRLLAGHTKGGNWSLGQICNHLTKTVVGSLEGYELRPPWILRYVVAPIFLKRMLKTGRMPTGVKAPAPIAPGEGLDDRAEAEALRAALKLFAAHTEPLPNHPLFGRLSHAQFERVHCIHAAHHLSFLHPVGASGANV